MDLAFERDWETDPYWNSNRFWKKFIENTAFDHLYFIDIFKTIVGDCQYRYQILKFFLGISATETFLHNVYHPSHDFQTRLHSIVQCVRLALQLKKKAYITWEYPPIRHDFGVASSTQEGRVEEVEAEESHIVMYVVDGANKRVISVDSRGTHFARNRNDEWKASYLAVRTIFKDFQWFDAIQEDLQSKNFNDSFCQTWSLIMTIVIERVDLSRADGCQRMREMLESVMSGYSAIIRFYFILVSKREFKQILYYEIYRQTHSSTGEREYNRYFSALEALVTGSNKQFYPHNVPYESTGYTFLEEFVLALNESTFNTILS